MKILVTGSNGFIGRNLCNKFEKDTNHTLLKANRYTEELEMIDFARNCDFVYHLAGVCRPENNDFIFNEEYTSYIIRLIELFGKKVPIVFTSSVYANGNTPYGESKRNCEELLMKYKKDNEVPVYIYRLENVFGELSIPNYCSFVATFCENIINGKELEIQDRKISLMYIDDVVNEFVRVIDGNKNIIKTYNTTVGTVAKKLYEVSKNNITDELSEKLNNTYQYFKKQED